jgi:hypothetical protein
MIACASARNVVCKHVTAANTYYVDLGPLLETAETVSSITTIDAEDSALTVQNGVVLTVDTTVLDENGKSLTIEANTGISFELSGGTPDNGATKVTVEFVMSTGKTEGLDCLIDVQGRDV